MRPINLEDDEYGSEYEEKNGSQIKKCTKYPEERLKKFNPIPNEKTLAKMNYFFFPYNPVINTMRCMRFDINEKVDFLKNIQNLRTSRHISQDERLLI